MKFLLYSLFLFGAVFAQGALGAGTFTNGEAPHGFYRAGIRYGEKGDSLHIRWSHTAEADTFWVYKANLSLEYITNADMRTAWYNQPLRYERRMAIHHLKEHILGSPLRFSNLEDLSKNRNTQFLGKNFKEYFVK
jgi:hypothetical protein